MRDCNERNRREVLTPRSGSYIEFKPDKTVPPPTVEFIGDRSEDSIFDSPVVVFFAGALFGSLLVAAAVVF